MIEKLKAIPAYVYTGIVALIAIVFYIFKAKELDNANSKLETAEYKKQDALNEQETTSVQKKIEEVIEENNAKKQEHLTNEELAKKLDNI